MLTAATLIAIPTAAVAALVASGAYYGTLAPAGRGPQHSAGATAAVELIRNLVLAAGAAVLLATLGVADLVPALLIAAGLWIAFPVVLLAGSVFHEGVPVTSAALHAGDWLLKLVIVLGIVGLITG